MTREQWNAAYEKKKNGIQTNNNLSHDDWDKQYNAKVEAIKNDTKEKTVSNVSPITKGLSIAAKSIEGSKQVPSMGYTPFNNPVTNVFKPLIPKAKTVVNTNSMYDRLIPRPTNDIQAEKVKKYNDLFNEEYEVKKPLELDQVKTGSNYKLWDVPGLALNAVGEGMQTIKDAAIYDVRSLGNVIQGKKLDPEDLRSNTTIVDDILPEKWGKAINKFAEDNPTLGGMAKFAIETGLDPTTYIGGEGLIGNLAKVGKIGPRSVKGSIENLKMIGDANKKLLAVNPSIPLNITKEAVKPMDEAAATAETVKNAPVTGAKTNANKLPLQENKTAYEDIPIESHLPKEEPKVLIPEKDVSGFTAYTNDVDRIFEKAYGKNYEAAKAEYLTPLNEAKKNKVLMEKDIINSLKSSVVDKFGFKKGSKESAAIQWYGEKQKPLGTKKVIDPQTGKKINQLQVVEYSIDDLKREFPDKWQNIIEADKWFRKTYDETINKLNTSRKTIYGDVQAKVKAVDDEIAKLSQNLDNKTLERLGLQQGRVYKTNKEIDIAAQIKGLENRVGTYKKALENPKLKPVTKEVYTDKINNLVNRIDLKQQELKKANLYGQPTAKAFETTDKQIARLEKLIAARKDLLNSEQLWRGKMIPKRQDYYRHFREISDSVGGLKNLFDTPAQIDPNLVGISEFTKPNSKFLSLAQRRGKGEYTADAIGGMLDYTKAASYATHIDPQIQKFRNLATELAKETTDTREVNHFIEFLQDYANSLSGKTNPFDRPFQKVFSRKFIGAVNWVNGRVKSNTILGNFSSMLAQVANVPQAIATVKNPKHLIGGMSDTLKSIFQKSKPMEESGFLIERYGDELYSQFDTKLLDQPKKFAAWAMENFDKLGTRFTWNSLYRKALSEKIPNPIQYADDLTRMLVAGRGIGEVPLIQQSKMFQLIAPFQLEVANLWRVMGGMVKQKDFGGLALLLLANYGLNTVMENVRGSGVTFDPIGALQDALKEKDTSLLQKAGRLGGEFLSNIPLGSNIAEAAMSEEDRKKYLGRNDPTRFGNGLIAVKGLQDPWYKLALPFGGNQLKKTTQGLQTMSESGSYTQDKDGKRILRYPIAKSPENYIKSTLFGPYSTKESIDYYKNNVKQFGTSQTAAYDYAIKNGFDPKQTYNMVLDMRNLKPEGTHKGVTDSQKINLINKLDLPREKKDLLIKLFVKENERYKLLK